MASNRINRINEEIMKELSSLLRTVKDPRVQDTMISITRVETTPDLRYTKVYVSFLQRENAKQALTGLKSAGGYLRRELGHVVTSFAYYFNVVVYHRNNGTGKIDFALLPETGIKVAISLQIRYDVGKIFPFPKVCHCEPVLRLARQSVS